VPLSRRTGECLRVCSTSTLLINPAAWRQLLLADAVALSSVGEMAMWTFVVADATVPPTEGA
jgi:hypothetical protein